MEMAGPDTMKKRMRRVRYRLIRFRYDTGNCLLKWWGDRSRGRGRVAFYFRAARSARDLEPARSRERSDRMCGDVSDVAFQFTFGNGLEERVNLTGVTRHLQL